MAANNRTRIRIGIAGMGAAGRAFLPPIRGHAEFELAAFADPVEEIRGSGALEAAMDVAIEFASRSKTHVAAAPDLETRDMLEQVANVVCERSS